MPHSVQACVFDAYGTLFDVHSAVRRHAHRLGESAGEVSRTWRDKQLEYSWVRSLAGRHADFWQVTSDGLDYALAIAGASDAALHADLMSAYRSLAAYPEVPGVLEALRAAGLRTAILSNGSPDMLADAVADSGLENLLDAVLSVEDVAVYKPDWRVYQLACSSLDLEPGGISFQSANAWDAAGAVLFGFRVAWINRQGAPREYAFAEPHSELRDLGGLPGLLGIEPDPAPHRAP